MDNLLISGVWEASDGLMQTLGAWAIPSVSGFPRLALRILGSCRAVLVLSDLNGDQLELGLKRFTIIPLMAVFVRSVWIGGLLAFLPKRIFVT